jgi:hypothetical protein
VGGASPAAGGGGWGSDIGGDDMLALRHETVLLGWVER